MAGFAILDPDLTWIPHITTLNNLTLSRIQRGYFNKLQSNNLVLDYAIYVPPSLLLYTKLSLQSYFFAFWGILFLQIVTIFIVDKLWHTNIPLNATLWERLMHATLKSHFPLPYINWHEGDGNCNDHVKRHEAANHEVLLTTAVNLFFNLIMLTPMVILCKY